MVFLRQIVKYIVSLEYAFVFSVGKDRREDISLFYFSIYFWHYIFPKDVQRVRAQILGLERYSQRASIQKTRTLLAIGSWRADERLILPFL